MRYTLHPTRSPGSDWCAAPPQILSSAPLHHNRVCGATGDGAGADVSLLVPRSNEAVEVNRVKEVDDDVT